MNAVEIEEAISELALQPFDKDEFPFAFLRAFGNKETTIKRLRAGTTNKSDLGGVLQTNNIHIAIAEAGQVTHQLNELRESPATTRAKARFILATDGADFEAEDLEAGDTVACEYQEFPDHFGFFLPLAGISTVKQVRDSSFDIRATSRLNRLYVELLKDNPDWGTSEQRHEMNHFMARLIFCFFAEDTDIFTGESLFTDTVEQMSARDSSNTHEVISEIFRAMNTSAADRYSENLPRWTNDFPYVNGGLFSGSVQVPNFSKIARSYLIHIGNLDWTQINPDIFGSMIQAVADDEERGSLGMHYTSVPNILKLLNPLFLDDLREKLEEAGDNSRKLLNLRNRIARIRVFDPACGSGNFLVIAYKQMREIENEINVRRGEPGRNSDIPLTNFRGIELRDFSAEIARLALIIAEYQCDVLFRGQKEAIQEFLPLDAENWITCGNALIIDWLSICPPTGTGIKFQSSDLFEVPTDQSEIEFKNEGGETYICGNPPYKGSQSQTDSQKSDLKLLFDGRVKNWKSLDYVSGWFIKAVDYAALSDASTAFVTTNSICQGRQVETLWSSILSSGNEISFAHTSFKWSNLASHKAVVTVAIVGLSKSAGRRRKLFTVNRNGETSVKEVTNINPYLVPAENIIVKANARPLSAIPEMNFGSMPNDGGHLLLDVNEAAQALEDNSVDKKYIRPVIGTREFINGIERRCIWVQGNEYQDAKENVWLRNRFELVRSSREESRRRATNNLAGIPFSFGEVRQKGDEVVLVVSKTSSEVREYIPVGLYAPGTIVTEAFALFNAPLWSLSLIASRMHLLWIATICGKMKTDFRYSNTLGWNTFPLPKLTQKNKSDLIECAKKILVERELKYPATVADLYDPAKMPDGLRQAHDLNDEVLERIYVGRRFKNDTERLEMLFDLYTKMTSKPCKQAKTGK